MELNITILWGCFCFALTPFCQTLRSDCLSPHPNASFWYTAENVVKSSWSLEALLVPEMLSTLALDILGIRCLWASRINLMFHILQGRLRQILVSWKVRLRFIDKHCFVFNSVFHKVLLKLFVSSWSKFLHFLRQFFEAKMLINASNLFLKKSEWSVLYIFLSFGRLK